MSRRELVISAILILFVGLAGVLLVRGRQAECAYIPLLGEELLPNAALASAAGTNMPEGWNRAADGVELRGKVFSDDPDEWGFDLDGDGRALQLIGIANEVQTPEITVAPNQSYCFLGQALTDSAKQSSTRLRAVFDWRDTGGNMLAENMSDWQPVALWSPELARWSPVRAAFRAPEHAATLRVRLQPSSDDRVYLDGMHVRTAGWRLETGGLKTQSSLQPPAPSLQQWPNGAQAAVSFSFDWETAMGGLVHSRSVDDPLADEDPLLRAMRMREGVTTTLDIFRPHGVRATYYATGYNFLLGNIERRLFMDNPTYKWANDKNGWSDTWATKPWFSPDPYGTVETHSAWYFGDLVPKLLAERQDIQSHTFAHFAGTFVGPDDWRLDVAAWNEAAAERGVPPAGSVAFPWSSSAGMSDADWNTLAELGVTSATRTAWSQRQYSLFPRDAQGMTLDPRCRPVPGHEAILACPDFYLTEHTAVTATHMIDRTIDVGGMIDLWAHTEEVVSPSQIAAWTNVVEYVAQQRDAGKVWIAPLAEIAAWQQALDSVEVENGESRVQNRFEPMAFTITNHSSIDLQGLTVKMPMKMQRVTLNGVDASILNFELFTLNLRAGAQTEVVVWPA